MNAIFCLKASLLTIACCFILSTNHLQGQALSFDETVKYINNKLYFLSPYDPVLRANKNGDVVIDFLQSGVTFHFNLFEVTFEEEMLTNKGRLQIKCNELIKCNSKTTDTTTRHLGLTITIVRKEETKTIVNAFNHLRKQCTKEADPFDY